MPHYCLIAEDAAQEPLIMSERFDVALHNINQGVCFFDSRRRLILANRRYAEIYDLAFDSIRPGMTFAQIVELRLTVGSGPERQTENYQRWADEIKVGDQPSDSVVTLKNGRIIAIHLRIMPDRGWVATHEDITARRQAEHRLAHMARHDPLTGLPNRLVLGELLGQLAGRSADGEDLAVLCLDLDGFKRVNDQCGHPAGDALLCAVAQRLRATVRSEDVVVRLGGDEFAVIQIGGGQPDHAASLADRLIEQIGQPYQLDGRIATIGTSIGIAWTAEDDQKSDKLIIAADQALYRAKAAGRGTYCLFDRSMDNEAKRRHALEHDLRSAVANGELELFYQPTVNARTHALTGFEALIRWRHPERGVVSPAEFISVCEETGLITPLGEWVLREATLQAATWPDGLSLAVNISPVQFKSPRLVSSLRQALAVSGLASRRLEVEITETVLLRETEATMAVLHEVRGMGVRIALDDFGTGYSSIGYLRSFPFEKIKIDASFIADLGCRPNARAIIHAIVGLGRALDMSVTAEGIETPEQAAIAQSEGCRELQGFLFGRPLPAARLPELIARIASPVEGAARCDRAIVDSPP